MSKWLDKKIQEREDRWSSAAQREKRKEAIAAKKYRAATRHERMSIIKNMPASENTLLNTLLDQWEEREYGIVPTSNPIHIPEQSILLSNKEQGRRLHCARKKEAITILGGVCESCGETNPNVLEVHHIHNNGGEHRLQMFRSIRGNPNIHKWVIENHEIAHKSVELLCANCHALKTYRTKKSHDAAVQLLGGECSMCGLPDIRAIELNHHNGNGKQHRKEVGNTAAWVLRVGAEEASRVVSPLCSNCHALWHSTCQDMAK